MKLFAFILIISFSLLTISCSDGEDVAETKKTSTLEDENIETLHDQLEVILTAFQASNGKWGFKNQDGETVIKPNYLKANDFYKEGIAAVADTNGWKYIDTKGKTVIRPYMEDKKLDVFANGLSRFYRNDKFGYFDLNGQIVIEAKFDKALPFSEGLAAVCTGCRRVTEEGVTRLVGGKWGYININGDFVISPKYSRANSFSGGKAKVRSNENWKYISRSGNSLSN